jgi:hypothetical protein
LQLDLYEAGLLEGNRRKAYPIAVTLLLLHGWDEYASIARAAGMRLCHL